MACPVVASENLHGPARFGVGEEEVVRVSFAKAHFAHLNELVPEGDACLKPLTAVEELPFVRPVVH